MVELVSSVVYPKRQTIPKFLPSPMNVTVHKGELAELVCHIQNLGTKMVVWRRASEENPLTLGTETFTPEEGISVSHARIDGTETKWNLLIKNVQPRHAGVYECSISSKGTYTNYVALHVIKTPALQKPELTITGPRYVDRYQDIRLVCNATGVNRAPDDVDWFFRGNRIVETLPQWYGRIEIYRHRPIPGLSFISELIIHMSTMEDDGKYVCRSSDLNVNSIEVTILNNGETAKFPRAPGEESGSMKTADTGLNQAAMFGVYSWLLSLTFTLVILSTNRLLMDTRTFNFCV
ncbi:hypothetical protein ACF0H5_012883 [Mactra antiquata]